MKELSTDHKKDVTTTSQRLTSTSQSAHMNKFIGQAFQKVVSIAPRPTFTFSSLRVPSPIIPLQPVTPTITNPTPPNFVAVLNKKGKVVKKKHAKKAGKHIRVRFRG